MKALLFIILALITAIVVAVEPGQHKTLKEFCIATGADTAANCECGQAIADRIMSKDEQVAALAMMQGDRETFQRYAEMHDTITQKMAEVSKGCSQQS